MSNFEVTTNNQPRPLFALYELPAEALPDFDYIQDEDQYTPRLFKYRGAWYDTGDCERSSVPCWQGMFGETFFSAVVFSYCNDYEQVIVGHAYNK